MNNNLYKETALDKELREIREKHRRFALKKQARRKITIASSSAALITLVSTLVGCSGKKKIDSELPTTSIETLDVNNSVPEETSKPEVKKIDSLSTTSLSNLGKELELPKKETPKKEFGVVTGNINSEKIVEDNQGTVWATPEAESRKDEVDKVVIDDNNGTLDVKPDGTVEEKTPSYEIKDDNGQVIEEGTLDSPNDIPDGWAYDAVLGKYLPEDEVGKYVKDSDGNIWLKSDYENYIKEQAKINESKTSDTVVTKEEIIPMDPVVIEESEIVYYDTDVSDNTTPDTNTSDNPYDEVKPPEDINGLYLDPISGLYFESKADYEQWVFQDYEGYNLVNGVMKAQTKEMDDALKQYTKTM